MVKFMHNFIVSNIQFTKYRCLSLYTIDVTECDQLWKVTFINNNEKEFRKLFKVIIRSH